MALLKLVTAAVDPATVLVTLIVKASWVSPFEVVPLKALLPALPITSMVGEPLLELTNLRLSSSVEHELADPFAV